jgi:hypothetical protein
MITESSLLDIIFFDNFMHSMGKTIIIIGLLVVAVGLVVYFAGDKLSWLGKLPGDIRIEKENFRFYFPVTTMILLSIVISLVVAVIKKFLQ